MATSAAKKGLPKIRVAIDIAAMRRGLVQALTRLKPGGRKKPAAAPVDGERTLSTEIDTGVGRHLVTRHIKTSMGVLAAANKRHHLLRNAALASPFLLVGAVV